MNPSQHQEDTTFSTSSDYEPIKQNKQHGFIKSSEFGRCVWEMGLGYIVWWVGAGVWRWVAALQCNRDPQGASLLWTLEDNPCYNPIALFIIRHVFPFKTHIPVTFSLDKY